MGRRMATEMRGNKVSGGRKRKPPDLRNDRGLPVYFASREWGWMVGECARLTADAQKIRRTESTRSPRLEM
jgi:hypothetical protein